MSLPAPQPLARDSQPTVGVVILTMGERPSELAQALASVLQQRNVTLSIAVVGNGWAPAGLPAGVTAVPLAQNVGIPAGRNAGVPHVTGDFLFFLDDDASIPDPHFLETGIAKLQANRRMGVLQPRITDPSGGQTPRRWIPRLRKGEPTRSSRVFSLLEAAVLTRRQLFDAIGGWGAPYFYAHEGIELAWRVWNAGYVAWYAGDLSVVHPVTSPTRHNSYYRMNARNRVWLAKRNLPWIMVPFYVGSWTAVQLGRWTRKPRGLAAWFAGWAEGWRTTPGGRTPLRLTTIARMTVAGRPPII
jgi:GT2 family glycosyltransferase